MPKVKKKTRSSEKPHAAVKLNSVLVEALQHETESDEAFDQIFSFISKTGNLEEAAVKRTVLTGTFGNRIIKHGLELTGRKGSTFLKAILPGLELSVEEIDKRLSSSSCFSFKLDKQLAYQEQLVITTAASDCIQVLVRFAAHGPAQGRREMVLKSINEMASNGGL